MGSKGGHSEWGACGAPGSESEREENQKRRWKGHGQPVRSRSMWHLSSALKGVFQERSDQLCQMLMGADVKRIHGRGTTRSLVTFTRALPVQCAGARLLTVYLLCPDSDGTEEYQKLASALSPFSWKQTTDQPSQQTKGQFSLIELQ